MRKPLEAIDRSVAIDRGPQASALGRPLLAHRDTHMAHTQGRTRKHLGRRDTPETTKTHSTHTAPFEPTTAPRAHPRSSPALNRSTLGGHSYRTLHRWRANVPNQLAVQRVKPSYQLRKAAAVVELPRAPLAHRRVARAYARSAALSRWRAASWKPWLPML